MNAPDVCLCHSKPIANLVSKRTNQALMFILALYYIYFSYIAALVVNQHGYFPASNVRFQLLRPDNAASNLSQVLYFGLLMDGCKIQATESQMLYNGTATFHSKLQSKDMKANGYYFQTQKTFFHTPIRWILQIDGANGTDLLTVGASVWRLDAGGTTLFYPQLTYIPAAGNTLYRVTELHSSVIEIAVDMRPPIQWSATYISIYSSNAICLVLGLLAAVLRKEGFVSYTTICLFTFGGTIELLAAIGYSSVNAEREHWCMMLLVPGDLMFALGIHLFESQLVKILFVYSTLGFLAVAIQEYLYEFDGVNTVFRVLQSAYAAPTMMACIIIVFRWRAMNHARHLICKDKERYQSIWKASISHSETLIWLSKLKSEVDCLQASIPRLIPRQHSTHHLSDSMYGIHLNSCLHVARKLSGQWSPKFQLTNLMPQIKCSTTPNGQLAYPYKLQYVNNLDQLYVQATCMHPVLIRKVSDWASKSRGLASVPASHGPHQWISYADLDVNKREHIKWCKLKSVQRAVEKAVRSYGQVSVYRF